MRLRRSRTRDRWPLALAPPARYRARIPFRPELDVGAFSGSWRGLAQTLTKHLALRPPHFARAPSVSDSPRPPLSVALTGPRCSNTRTKRGTGWPASRVVDTMRDRSPTSGGVARLGMMSRTFEHVSSRSYRCGASGSRRRCQCTTVTGGCRPDSEVHELPLPGTRRRGAGGRLNRGVHAHASPLAEVKSFGRQFAVLLRARPPVGVDTGHDRRIGRISHGRRVRKIAARLVTWRLMEWMPSVRIRRRWRGRGRLFGSVHGLYVFTGRNRGSCQNARVRLRHCPYRERISRPAP